MGLQTSGTISASDINQELERSNSANFNLGGNEERDLAEIASGTISFSDFYGAKLSIEANTSWKQHSSITTFEDVIESDDGIAEVQAAGGTRSGSVELRDYGFNIPEDAEVTGVEIECSGSLTGAYEDGYIRVALRSDQDSSDTFDLPEDGSTITIGGPDDPILYSGGGLDPSRVNSSSFGAGGFLEVFAPFSQPGLARLITLEIRVFYVT